MSHAAGDYAAALLALLPMGSAWQWQPDGFGYNLILATSAELARVDSAAVGMLGYAVNLHRPGAVSYLLADYQRVADEALQAITRKPAAVGCTIGYRMWSDDAAIAPALPSVSLSHLIAPAAIGAVIGSSLWGSRSRYYLHVKFDQSIINKSALNAALMAFKQAHVYLYCDDVVNFI